MAREFSVYDHFSERYIKMNYNKVQAIKYDNFYVIVTDWDGNKYKIERNAFMAKLSK